jgi:hypothetical protein
MRKSISNTREYLSDELFVSFEVTDHISIYLEIDEITQLDVLLAHN